MSDLQSEIGDIWLEGESSRDLFIHFNLSPTIRSELQQLLDMDIDWPKNEGDVSAGYYED